MTDKNIDFEKAMSELEEIIKHLESGECSLEESIKLFEKGVKLTNGCRNALDNAKERIITLTELKKEELKW